MLVSSPVLLSGGHCGWSSGHSYGEAVGDAVSAHLHLSEIWYEAGMGATDSATL